MLAKCTFNVNYFSWQQIMDCEMQCIKEFIFLMC